MGYVNTILGNIILSLAVMIYGKIILKENKIDNKVMFVIASLVVGILYGILSVVMSGTLKSIICMFIQAFAFKIIYNKVSLLKSIFMSVLYMVLLIPAEIIIIFSFIEILGMDSNYFYNVFSNSLIANIIISLLFIAFVAILKKPLKRVYN